ncbi:phage adaptor protein [Paenibacillus pasadenensis]|uniref:phage adaptor protein n=1 Tax=Paenibacillus pasadenensis TaxID=217090 RepID=UPI00048EBEC6|nr:hypothetical protein [Paenibacillus pasadenensis]
MNVDQILTIVSSKYPHGFDDTYLFLLLSNAVKEYSRYLYQPETATSFDIISGNPFYSVPFSPSNIIGVLVDGCTYKRDAIPGYAPGYFYYVTEGNSLNLYPTPTKDIPGGLVVFHYMEPAPISGRGQIPDFDEAWHMMLVYRLCKELAESAQDTAMANGFVAQYNDLEEQYMRSRVYPPMQIQNVFGGLM